MSEEDAVLQNPWRICNECSHTLQSIIILSSDRQNVLNYLYDHNVLPKNKVCPECGNAMTLNENKNMFTCHKRRVIKDAHRRKVSTQCNKKISQFSNTWFSKAKIAMEKVFLFVAYWCFLPNPRLNIIMNELDISRVTVVHWSNYLREVCFLYFRKNDERIGGVGKVVEINEAKIGKRKCNRGRTDGNWVYGGIERDSKKCFIVPVAINGHEALITTIKNYILPGTTVMSDCWRKYNCLQTEGFQDLIVNRNYDFVEPDAGVHTQNVNRLWRDVCYSVPRFGNSKHHLHGHIAEFLFKRKFSDYKLRLHHIWCMIADLYDNESFEEFNDSIQASEDGTTDSDDY